LEVSLQFWTLIMLIDCLCFNIVCLDFDDVTEHAQTLKPV